MSERNTCEKYIEKNSWRPLCKEQEGEKEDGVCVGINRWYRGSGISKKKEACIGNGGNRKQSLKHWLDSKQERRLVSFGAI